MEVPSARPSETQNLSREAQAKPQSSNPKSDAAQVDAAVQAPSEAPDAGGVVASTQAESDPGPRDPAAQTQTKDASALAEFVRELSRKAGAPGTTRLAIDVDEESNESRFLILNKETGEVLKQIPADDVLPMLRDKLSANNGLLVNRRV